MEYIYEKHDFVVDCDCRECVIAEREKLRLMLAGAVNTLDLLRTKGCTKYEYAYSRENTLVHVGSVIEAATVLLPQQCVLE